MLLFSIFAIPMYWYENMIRKELSVFLSLLVLAGVCAGCGSANKTTRDETTVTQPQLLIVSGTISYDSVKATYEMTVSSQRRVDGALNLESGLINGADVQGLNYVQLGRKDKILRVYRMDNPLVQQMEYHDGDRMGRMTVRLKEAVYNIRIPLDPMARRICFRNDDDVIMTLDIK